MLTMEAQRAQRFSIRQRPQDLTALKLRNLQSTGRHRGILPTYFSNANGTAFADAFAIHPSASPGPDGMKTPS